MTSVPDSRHHERGIALVMALLVLLVISLLTVTLLITINVDKKISGHTVREAQALNVAEAGVAEAMSRIRNFDVPNNMNPRMVTQIFLAPAGSVPVLGADSIGLPTGQPVGSWLAYSTATKDPDALTIQYKTDANHTAIYRYDQNLAQPVNTVTGLPIYVIHATGRRGNDVRRVVSEVIQKPFNAHVNGAITCNKGIDFSGNSEVCGYNHRPDTPSGTRPAACAAWHVGTFDLPGAWSSDSITTGGSANQDGVPPRMPGQSGFYPGPWDALGLSQADFYSWVGSPYAIEPSDPKGIYYLDNNTIGQDATGSFHYNGGNGEGMLYVDGDLAINGNFTYRGLIYVEGDLKINGTCWILGGLIVNGKTKIKIANGTCTILYSKDAIAQNMARYGGQFVTLSWREY